MAENSGKAARGKGRPFRPGESGNPGGRPKLVAELRERALKAVDEQVLAAWIEELKPRPVIGLDGLPAMTTNEHGEPCVRTTRGEHWLKSAEMLAAYGMGKPVQIFEHGGRDGGKIELEVRFVKGEKK